MTTPAMKKSLNAMQALVLLAIVVLYLVKGLPDTKGEITLNVVLAMLFCWTSSFALLGARFGAITFVVSYILSWTAEEIGVRTGLVFGRYYYTDVLGAKLGSVPFVIPIYWYLLLYSGYVIAALVIKRGQAHGGGMFHMLWRSLLVALVVTNFDLVFDPYMVYKVKAWVWEGMSVGQGYFGVPVHNYYGWIGTAFVLSMVLQLIHARMGSLPPGERTMFTILAPVALYASYWLSYTRGGFPDPVRVIALIAMGIPTIAAVAAWCGLAPKQAEEIADEIF